MTERTIEILFGQNIHASDWHTCGLINMLWTEFYTCHPPYIEQLTQILQNSAILKSSCQIPDRQHNFILFSSEVI